MKITTRQPQPQTRTSELPVPPQKEASEPPQDSLEPGLLRKTGAAFVAAGAGAAGGVYGGVRGLIQGLAEVGQTTVEGGRIGTRAMAPLTRTLGAVASVALTGVAGAGALAAVVVGPVAGMLTGTAVSASERLVPMTQGAARTAAQAGIRTGSAALGAVGGALGALVGLCSLPTILYPPLGMRVIPQALRSATAAGYSAGSCLGQYVGGAVGGTLGAAGGGLAAVATGLPEGAKLAARVGQATLQGVGSLPGTARDLWEAGQNAGQLAAQVTGGTVGVVAGGVTGLVASPFQGLLGGVETAADWGGATYRTLT